MEGIFIKLLNLSIQASILITVVLLLRFILNKSPKSIKCLLWALVAIRLVCPFSIESKFSLAPDAEVVSMDNYVGMPNVLSKTTGSDRYVKGYAESYDHEVVTVEKKNTDPLHIFSIIWLGGVVILAVYALGSCLKIWRRVKLSIRTTENIYICDRIDSPFIFGIIKPRIYLPSRMNEEQKESVIAHERAHLKRFEDIKEGFVEDYIPLPGQYDINEYRIMEEFIYELPVGKNQDVLARTIQGRGAFRRFKDKLYDLNLEKQWYQYREEAYEKIARQWSERHKIDIVE